MEPTAQAAEPVHRVKGKPGPKPKAAPVAGEIVIYPNAAAQAHALRIWGGQSVDVPVAERVRRVVAGLQEQGMSLDIKLPHPEAGRHLETY